MKDATRWLLLIGILVFVIRVFGEGIYQAGFQDGWNAIRQRIMEPERTI